MEEEKIKEVLKGIAEKKREYCSEGEVYEKVNVRGLGYRSKKCPEIGWKKFYQEEGEIAESIAKGIANILGIEGEGFWGYVDPDYSKFEIAVERSSTEESLRLGILFAEFFRDNPAHNLYEQLWSYWEKNGMLEERLVLAMVQLKGSYPSPSRKRFGWGENMRPWWK